MSNEHRFKLNAVAVALLALAAGSASAQSAEKPAEPQTKLDTVTVTATKTKGQRLLEAPLAVQALTGEDLAAKNITSISDLVSAVPGASQSEQLGEFIRAYSIRGSGAGGGIGDALVGYYIDEVAYIIPNAQWAPPLRLQDIDRVEILRGPYGTLYGSGAMGGTMVFHTKDPNLKRSTFNGETYVSQTSGAGAQNYGLFAAASMPLIPNELAIRIGVGGDYRAGYADVYSGAPTGVPRATDANDSHKGDVRATVLWRPSQELSVRAQAMRFVGNQNYSQQMSGLNPPLLAHWSDVKGFEKSYNEVYGLSVDYKFDFATLTSATGYTTTDTSYLYGMDIPLFGQTMPVALFNGYRAHSFSQELRLASNGAGPLHWLGGLFYNSASNDFGFNAALPVGVLAGNTVTRTENKSVFGEVSYDLLGGKLVPLIGVRFYQDDRGFVSGADAGSANPSVATWRANLSYHPQRDTTVYGNAGTGFRSGIMQSALQANSLKADNIEGKLALDPDKMRNLELGMKGRLSIADVRYDMSLYDVRYTSMQTGLTTSQGISAFASIGDASIRGADLQLEWSPVESLTLGLAADVNRARYLRVNPLVASGAGGVKNGGLLLNTPRFTTRFDIGYLRPVGEGLMLHSNLSVSVSGGRMNQAGTFTARTTIVDGNIGLSKGPYDLELFATNLTNERGPWFIRTANLVGGPIPRTIGIRLRTDFH